MPCALFGKIQTKRDFIAPGAPRAFLDRWEPWMQAGLATSRMMLDRAWQERFLTAPIWRFWLGERICGHAIAGAFMPSLDAVGRYYPLAGLGFAPAGGATPPPDIDPQEEWFAALEDFLLSTLDPATDWETTMAALAALPSPAALAPTAPSAQMTPAGANGFMTPIDDASPRSVFEALMQADWAATHAERCCLWTAGGPDFRPVAISTQGLPGPEIFVGLLTGDFRAAGAAVPA